MLAIGSFCDCFNLRYVCLSLLCKGSEVDLIVSVSEFPYVLYEEWICLVYLSSFRIRGTDGHSVGSQESKPS